jgi:hypothetical protein
LETLYPTGGEINTTIVEVIANGDLQTVRNE